MARGASRAELREGTHILGEMAAARLFALLRLRLEELRERENITQADIAGRLGVSEQLVSRWLREPRNMTVRGAGRLLAALDAHLLFELDRFEDIAASEAANEVDGREFYSSHPYTGITARSSSTAEQVGEIKSQKRMSFTVTS